MTAGGERLFRNLKVQLGEGKIGWDSSFSPPWSFHLFRLETILPFSLQVKTGGDKLPIRISLKNLNSFSLQDLLLIYNDSSFFLKELPPSDEADLTLELKKKEFSSSLYFQKIMLRGPGPQVELKKKIFQQMWSFQGPLKKLTTRSPVLLAWFEEFPENIVDHPKINFIGLLIMPLGVFST